MGAVPVGGLWPILHANLNHLPLCRCRWVVPLLWLPVAALLARRALRAGLLLGPVAALAAGGVLLWQLIEYSMHRWLFHVVPSSPLAILAHFLMHGCAHSARQRLAAAQRPCPLLSWVEPPLSRSRAGMAPPPSN